MLTKAGSALWVPVHIFLLWFHGSLPICIAAALWRAVLRMGMSLERHQFFSCFFEVKEDIFKPGSFEWFDFSTAQQTAASAQMPCKWWHLDSNKRQGHLAKKLLNHLWCQRKKWIHTLRGTWTTQCLCHLFFIQQESRGGKLLLSVGLGERSNENTGVLLPGFL